LAFASSSIETATIELECSHGSLAPKLRTAPASPCRPEPQANFAKRAADAVMIFINISPDANNPFN
jgi:hypothetical protein